MIEIHAPILKVADIAAQAGDRSACLAELRKLGLDDFGDVLFNLPLADYPALTRVLPRMTPEDIQQKWTGATGQVLLQQTLGIVRILESIAWRNLRRPLSSAKILDFGCGYGRLLRLMYFYQEPAKIFGCDPWTRSMDLCRDVGLIENIALSSYHPEDLPYPDSEFDFIYAFSVFTHLSARATADALKVLRRKISSDGVLVITIRPIEFWPYAQRMGLVPQSSELEATHALDGFAFMPHNRAPVDGEVTYGETSMSTAYLAKNFPEWKLVSTERQLTDPYQLLVTLKPT